ncbi:MAG: cysteine desulfurase [Parcubacteria group bacterium]|nr:cysteine desulfurase [Parcubacteria group bacterium]
MKKEIYLDNAAATPVNEKVLKTMEPFSNIFYGNPSSFNDAGRQARKALDQSRRVIARFLGAQDREIIFTGSGTEANNMAILGLIKAVQGLSTTNYQSRSPRDRGFSIKSELPISNKRKPHVITTKIEHPSVLRPIQYLEKTGQVCATYLPVDKNGIIKLDDLKKALRPETILISIIYVNNEIGSVQPIKKISKFLKEFKSSKFQGSRFKLIFHIDACQATGYLDMNVNNLGVDLMTINSSKIHGPKGIGALYIRQGTPIQPLVLGGGQEGGLRSGTENVAGIVGLAEAIEIIQKSKLKNQNFNSKLKSFKSYFIENILRSIPNARINGNVDESVPHIISITIPDIEAEAVLLMLDKYGIRASAGAACSAHDMEVSHVLTAIGLSKKDARATLRFSLGRQNAKEEVDYVIKILPKVVKEFHRLYPENLKNSYYIKS